MRFNIDRMIFQGGVIHNETQWDIIEILNGVTVNTLTVPYSAGNLLAVDYEPVDYHSHYFVTTTRRLNDGSTVAPWTDRLSLTECNRDLHTTVVTPTPERIKDLVITSSTQGVSFKVDSMVNFIGTNVHRATTWIFRNSAGVIVYARRYSIDDLYIVTVNESFLKDHGVITLECIFHTDKHKSSFRGVVDFNLSSEEKVNFIVDNYLPNHKLYAATVNRILFERFPRSSGDYEVSIILNNEVIETYDTWETLNINTDGMMVGAIVTVKVTAASFDTTNRDYNRVVTKDFIVIEKDDMDELNRSYIDIDSIGITLVKTLSSKIDLSKTDTIELKSGIVPTLDLEDKRLNLYTISDNEIVGHMGHITLEPIESTKELVNQVRVRLIDNATLAVVYVYTDVATPGYNLHLGLKLFRITNIATLDKYAQIYSHVYELTTDINNIGGDDTSAGNILLNTVINNSINWSSLTGDLAGYVPYDTGDVDSNPDVGELYSKVNNLGSTDRITSCIVGTDFMLMTEDDYDNGTELSVPNIEDYLLIRRLDQRSLLFLNTATETRVYEVNQ